MTTTIGRSDLGREHTTQSVARCFSPRKHNPHFTIHSSPFTLPQQPVWLQVGTLIDGVSTSPLHDAHFVYNAHEILHAATTPPPAHLVANKTAPDQHLPTHTVLPGLIEAHAHLFLEGAELDFSKRKDYLQQPPTLLLAKAIMRLEKLLKLGIIAYRDAGDNDGVGIALSKLYRSPSHPAMPYVESPGAAIHHAGRYGTFMSAPIEDHADPAAVVAHRVAAGADRIKLIPTGIINFQKGLVTAKPQMSADEVKAFTTAAKAHHKQTFAHASGADGIQNAIDGGVDSIEHGFFITDDQLAQIRDLDIAWIPTFAPVQLQVDHAQHMGWDTTVITHLQRILDNHSASLVKAQALGVKIIAGSDAGSCGVGHGIHFHYELELIQRAGLTPLQVINAATGTSSSRLNYTENFGILKPGYKPRFILTEHDPLVTVTNLQLPKTTHFDGKQHPSTPTDDHTGL